MVDWSPIAKLYDPLKAGSIDGTDVEPHDRAVWRAMCARYKPAKGVVGDPLLTLFVARLNPQTAEDKLHQVFSKYGDIRQLRLVRDIVTGFSKCYAFIEYKEERSVVRARRDANKLVVDQHEVFVDFELERTLKGWVPRRLGGGLGGKKESGQLRFGGRDRPFRKPINLVAGPGQEWTGGGGGGGGWREWDRPGARDWESRHRGRETDRDRSRDVDRDRSRDVDQDRSRDVDRDRSREMDRDRSRDVDRDRSRDVDRDRSRDVDRDRSRDVDRDRSREADRDRVRETDRDRIRETDRDRSRGRREEHDRGRERDERRHGDRSRHRDRR